MLHVPVQFLFVETVVGNNRDQKHLQSHNPVLIQQIHVQKV